MIVPVVISVFSLWAAAHNPVPQAASWAAGHPIAVVATGDSWGAGHTYQGSTQIWVSGATLTDARSGFGPALEIVLHEVGHTLGIENERQASCYGLAHVREALNRFWHLTAKQVNEQVRMAETYVAGLPAKYSAGACL